MPDLLQNLQNKDPGFLEIIAGLWGIELQSGQAGEPATSLAAAMLEPGRLEGVLESLPTEPRQALGELALNQGRVEWAGFARRFGAIREMGVARRAREQPHLNPTSAAEQLWYCGLLGRAFLDTPSGPQEFAYLPTEFQDRLPELQANADRPGRPATPAEQAEPHLVSDHILDHACSLLAAARLGLSFDAPEFRAISWEQFSPMAPPPATLQALLSAAELINPKTSLPDPELSRHFLELPRAKALALLARAWLHSSDFNELRLLPGLRCEGEWRNDPLKARYTMLEFLNLVPANSWWSLDAFVQSIKGKRPDFQRPAGDYDSWYIRVLASGEYLRGFGAWESVDGALVRYMVSGPLHWLGILEVASESQSAPISAFRLSPWANALLNGAPPPGLEAEDDTMLVSSDARLRVPRRVARMARYQLSRFSVWESATQEVYAYRLTPASLARARQQGLRIGHLLTLLRRYALTIPPNLVRALERWEENGVEARLEQAVVLRLRTPEILQTLRNSKYNRFLGEPLGTTAIIVKPGAWRKVLSALADLGLLGEGEIDEN